MTDAAKKGMMSPRKPLGKEVLPMEERPVAPETAASYDIFLCTRELPDALTAETAALRQLCSALIGAGWRVFFPSALPKELTDEQRARTIVDALDHSRVLVAAGVGEEYAADPVAAKLRAAFREKAVEDPERHFVACWRDAAPEALPEDLRAEEILDMSDLGFLVTLREKLTAWLTPPETEESAEEPAPAPVKKPFPWKWLLLAAAVIAAAVWRAVRK